MNVKHPSSNSGFMSGSLYPGNGGNTGRFGDPDDAMFDIDEEDESMAVATWGHRHLEVAADGNTGAFLYDMNEEQPSPVAADELPLCHRTIKMI